LSIDKNYSLEIFLTVDYEIHFSRSLMTEEDILITPTTELLACCSSLECLLPCFAMKSTYFRCREWGHESFVEAVEQQLCDAVSQGHDVQLHLHPHWEFTERDSQCRFHFDHKHYLLGARFTDISTRKADISQMVAKGKEYLENLLKPMDTNYKCCEFLAGF
jgi:hypothetical protein